VVQHRRGGRSWNRAEQAVTGGQQGECWSSQREYLAGVRSLLSQGDVRSLGAREKRWYSTAEGQVLRRGEEGADTGSNEVSNKVRGHIRHRNGGMP